ncbi:hypothetical protein GGR53DRAFT_471609 [Hypoxylon sp. FL1150]|nr:hypothetical protein GGR53DRAFT_471609 [Hypoxylon sp. FL1150]
MKNFGAIIILLATAGSFVSSTPAFKGEKRALSSQPGDVAARAPELVPHRAERRNANVNATGNTARSLAARGGNATEANAHSLFVRQSNSSSEAGNEKHAPIPKLRRGHWEMRSSNETGA